MKKYFILLVPILLFCLTVNANDKAIPPEKLGWMQRALVPEVIGKLKKTKEAGNWCIYEEEQEHPDPVACRLAKQLRNESTIVHDTIMIKTAIRELRAAPQSPIIKEHVRVLEAALDDIMDTLKRRD